MVEWALVVIVMMVVILLLPGILQIRNKNAAAVRATEWAVAATAGPAALATYCPSYRLPEATPDATYSPVESALWSVCVATAEP